MHFNPKWLANLKGLGNRGSYLFKGVFSIKIIHLKGYTSHKEHAILQIIAWASCQREKSTPLLVKTWNLNWSQAAVEIVFVEASVFHLSKKGLFEALVACKSKASLASYEF